MTQVKGKQHWEVRTLGEVCDFQRGLTYSKKDEVDLSENVVLRANNINLPSSSLDFSELKYINKKIQIPEDKKVKKGSLIICTASGSKSHLGKIAFIDEDYNYAFGGFMGQITPKREVDSKFLFYIFISKAYKDLIKNLSSGVNINNLKFSDLKDFEIPLPPLPEQKRLVGILDEAFEKLDALKARAEANLANAKELFQSALQQLFSDPGEEWEKKRLDEISVEFGRGKSKHRPRNDKKLFGGSYPFIQTGDVRNSEHYIKNFSQSYNDFGLAQSKLWPKGTVCITIAANIAETGILSFEACFPDSIIGLVPDENITTPDFVEYLLNFYSEHLKKQGQGSAQDNINMGTFQVQYFYFPPLDIQKSIVTKLDKLSAQTKKLEAVYQKKLDNIEELKKSILQKAFSGEL